VKLDMRPGGHKITWLVWEPGCREEVDAIEVIAADAEQAAADYAEWSDGQGDYDILDGNEATVHVRRAAVADGTIHRFTVTGESVPVYHARWKKEGVA